MKKTIEILRARDLSEKDRVLVEQAITAAKNRQDIEYFSEEKNILELESAVEYVLNPPVKSGRKV